MTDPADADVPPAGDPGPELPAGLAGSLCARCAWVRRIASGKGSVFLLCRRAAADPRFARYPAQPVLRCSGFAEGERA